MTSERVTSICCITNHCIDTVNNTGIVVNNAYLGSLKTIASVKRVAAKANPRDVHCEPTIKSFTAIVTAATPISCDDAIPPGLHQLRLEYPEHS